MMFLAMLACMEKPIVFLSHSSKNKEELAVLKELLQAKSVGAIEFFLSSDGQSIRFGSNWVARISEALDKAKVMFVFISPESVASKWIHFEAGCAYSKGIQVVPVCLPGIQLNQVHPPLSLLQGFNLHSSDALNNVPAICNDVFGLNIPGNFSDEDFQKIFQAKADSEHYFGVATDLIDTVMVTVKARASDLDALADLYRKRGLEFDLDKKQQHARLDAKITTVAFRSYGIEFEADVKEPGALAALIFTLSPELFAMNANLLELWNQQIAGGPFVLTISLQAEVLLHGYGQRQTTKIYGTGIQIARSGKMQFGDLEFEVMPRMRGGGDLVFENVRSFDQKALPSLVTKLFESGVIFSRTDLESSETTRR